MLFECDNNRVRVHNDKSYFCQSRVPITGAGDISQGFFKGVVMKEKVPYRDVC